MCDCPENQTPFLTASSLPLWQSVFEHTPTAISVCRIREGSVDPVLINDAACRLCGYNITEYRAAMQSDPFFFIHPADKQLVARRFCCEAPADECQEFTFRVLCADGSARWVQLRALYLGRDGDSFLYSSYCTDVDDLQRMAVTERTVRAKLEAALHGMALAVWEYDPFLKTCRIDSEGYEPPLIVSAARFASYVPKAGPLDASSAAALDCLHAQISASSGSVQAELRCESGRWIHCTYTPVLSADGTLICAIGTAQDATAAKLREKSNEHALELALARLQQSSAEREELFARISHDMRTPISAISGMLELMRTSALPSSAQLGIDRIFGALDYLTNLVEDTLSLSVLNAPGLQLHPAPVAADTVLENICSCIKPSAEKAHITFLVDRHQIPSSCILADAFRLQQAFINILINAVRFTPAGGKICVCLETCSRSATHVRNKITIADTGVGISESFLPHIFEPFARESGTTHISTGVGLGLAIAKKIIDAMSGRIEIASRPGEGTTVTVWLQFTLVAPPQESAVSVPPSLGGKRILLCEDQPFNADVTAKLLQRNGCYVDTAQDGHSGVALFAQSDPGWYDAILMDLRMPILDGIAATRAIRALPRPDAAHIPIIALTSSAFPEDVRRAREAGMDTHLVKPILSRTLYRVLADLCSAPAGQEENSV